MDLEGGGHTASCEISDFHTNMTLLKKDGEIIFNLLCNCYPENIQKGSFTIHGKKVEFDERLSLEIDSPDCTWVETCTIPESWDCETIYRLRLKADLTAGTELTVALKINN